jgi:cysteine-rich repeat protein
MFTRCCTPSWCRPALMLGLAGLVVVQLGGVAGADDAKLPPSLRNAIERSRRGTLAPLARYAPGPAGGQRLPAESGPRPRLRIDARERAQVYIHLGCPIQDVLLDDLRGRGAAIERVTSRRGGIVQARVPLAALRSLAASSCVERVTQPSYSPTRVGSVTTEGDTILQANAVRTAPPAGFGVDGSGVKVGVISLGVLGLGTAQASGDLPAVTVLDGGCTDPSEIGCAEGTAMMEIVHDVAPGAVLGFYGPLTSIEFCTAVTELQQTFQADVIVDDLGFFAEPYFEDGLVAGCVADAVSAGTVYVSAAGNDGDTHYQAPFADSGDGLGSHQIAPGNAEFNVTGSQPLVIVQWSNPFGSSGDDYDLCLTGESANQCAAFNTQQNGNDDPIEVDSFNCTFGCSLQVRRVSGIAQEIELFVLGGSLASADRVAADGVFGHAAVPGALATGAIAASDPGHNTIEPFSSRGNATIFFPALDVRMKPDITGIDGVSVTGAAGFPGTFFGTSAAAPHLAGIAALILEANPNLIATEVGNVLAAGAVDLGAPAFDSTFGAGRADAFASVGVALCGNGTVDASEDCDDGNVDDGDCCSSTCTYEPQDAPCDDGNNCTSTGRCDGQGFCIEGSCQIGQSCGVICGQTFTCQQTTPLTCACSAN